MVHAHSAVKRPSNFIHWNQRVIIEWEKSTEQVTNTVAFSTSVYFLRH